MNRLQREFEKTVKEFLNFYKSDITYINVNVFEIWEIIKSDEEFIYYGLGTGILNPLSIALRYIYYTENIIEKQIEYYKRLIIETFKTNAFPYSALSNYASFVAYMLVIIYEYFNYYSIMNSNNLPDNYEEFMTKVFDEEDIKIIINGNINLIK